MEKNLKRKEKYVLHLHLLLVYIQDGLQMWYCIIYWVVSKNMLFHFSLWLFPGDKRGDLWVDKYLICFQLYFQFALGREDSGCGRKTSREFE